MDLDQHTKDSKFSKPWFWLKGLCARTWTYLNTWEWIWVFHDLFWPLILHTACPKICTWTLTRTKKNTECFACFWPLSPQIETGSEGAGIAQWLEHPTHDRRVPGLSPHRSNRIIFFSRVNYLLTLHPFHPCVTTVACKRSQSFCQKCRWQVTAKHTCTAYICGFK